ncbi:MAG: PEP-CTERM sorting domain-containing protein [Proteobacteria bacterium]|nr:PEP-CTERM sorting domain-containing protein [Pseudomonadota bacterium]
MNKFATIAAICCAATIATAQSTVDYTTTAWSDFGTTNIVSVAGNFLPGWTTLSATPDLGQDLFFIPTTSLSGATDDAALWFNQFDLSGPSAGSNEVARLSLSGFTIGQTYSLDFFATTYLASGSGWAGNNDALDVALSGANISDWDSTILFDAGDIDGINTWDAQSLVFTALSDTVSFDFGGNASYYTDIGTQATRFGIDGFSARVVPAPSSTLLLGLSGLIATRRRR